MLMFFNVETAKGDGIQIFIHICDVSLIFQEQNIIVFIGLQLQL